MKKSNKTYHNHQQQDSSSYNNNNKVSQSPGRIIKNNPATTTKIHKQKLLSQPSSSISSQYTNSCTEQIIAINKKVQQQLKYKQQQQLYQQRYEQRSQLSSNYSYGGKTQGIAQQYNRNNLQNTKTITTTINPYQQIYLNDKRYFQQYINSTSKYQHNGINLNWPYYFSKHVQTATK